MKTTNRVSIYLLCFGGKSKLKSGDTAVSDVKTPMDGLIKSARNHFIVGPLLLSTAGFAILCIIWNRGDSKTVSVLFCLGVFLLIVGLVLAGNGYGYYKEILSYRSTFPGKEWDAEFYLEWKKGTVMLADRQSGRLSQSHAEKTVDMMNSIQNDLFIGYYYLRKIKDFFKSM